MAGRTQEYGERHLLFLMREVSHGQLAIRKASLFNKGGKRLISLGAGKPPVEGCAATAARECTFCQVTTNALYPKIQMSVAPQKRNEPVRFAWVVCGFRRVVGTHTTFRRSPVCTIAWRRSICSLQGMGPRAQEGWRARSTRRRTMKVTAVEQLTAEELEVSLPFESSLPPPPISSSPSLLETVLFSSVSNRAVCSMVQSCTLLSRPMATHRHKRVFAWQRLLVEGRLQRVVHLRPPTR